MSPLPDESLRQRLAQEQQARANLQGKLQQLADQQKLPTQVGASQEAAREAALAAQLAKAAGNPGTFTSSSLGATGEPAVTAHGTNGESGIVADSDTGVAIFGFSDQSPQSIGVRGHSKDGVAVSGQSETGTGVSGISTSGTGVDARSDSFTAIYAASNSGTAINAVSTSGAGIFVQGGQYALAARSSGGIGIVARSDSSTAIDAESTSGVGIYAQGGQGQAAGIFQGDVDVNGNINVTGDVILTGADCAEEFDISEAVGIEPGTVMVLDQAGGLQQSQRAYDKRVAGVISGAGNYRPGLILGVFRDFGDKVCNNERKKSSVWLSAWATQNEDCFNKLILHQSRGRADFR